MKKDKLDIEGETFLHMVTVLSIMFGDARECLLEAEQKVTRAEWDRIHRKEKKLYMEARDYLKGYLEELIKSSK
jgi:hypothetical protein